MIESAPTRAACSSHALAEGGSRAQRSPSRSAIAARPDMRAAALPAAAPWRPRFRPGGAVLVLGTDQHPERGWVPGPLTSYSSSTTEFRRTSSPSAE